MAETLEGGLLPEKRYLVLNLPLWATDCLRRHEGALAASPRPLVLYEKQKSALRLVAVDARASRLGLSIHNSLSEARALVPDLEAREIDRPWLQALFADFADWHSYASPIVAVLPDMAAFGDLALDITGVAHLFGGEEKLLATITGRLKALGLTVHGGIAPSIGTAWALAHYRPGRIVSRAQAATGEVLADLPVGALRLSPAQIEGLSQMGLKRIGQLLERDRKMLQARFGASLINRLDQARAMAQEQIKPRIPVAERFVERRFADPIGLIDDVLMTAQDLAYKLSSELEAEGVGAQTFHLMIYRVDHKVMCLSVNSARATRDALHITRLFTNRTERLSGEFDAGFGIDMIRLAASTVSRLDSGQLGVFELSDGAADLDRLYDRMASRLGQLAVVRTVPVDTHIPERAVKLVSAIVAPDPDPRAAPDPELERPLRLLPSPEPIRVTAQVPDGPPASMIWRRISYRFLKASGPERIGEEWWGRDFVLSTRRQLPPPASPAKVKRGEDEPPTEIIVRHIVPSRDYYIAEDDGGRRFWLFRDGLYGQTDNPGWFLHGFFS